jgi:hypothetical protein
LIAPPFSVDALVSGRAFDAMFRDWRYYGVGAFFPPIESAFTKAPVSVRAVTHRRYPQ